MLVKDLLPKDILDRAISIYDIGKQYGKISITESYIEITISKE